MRYAKFYVIIALLAVAALIGLSSFERREPISQAALGELLFFDSILSKDQTISCGSCHRPGFAFADTVALSLGVNGKKGKRNTPTAMNMLLGKTFFWDGRAMTLEEQALAPIENPDEMNLPLDSAVRRLQNSRKYRSLFQEAFNSVPTLATLAQALAAFERTLETSNSPFDVWKLEDDSNAVSSAARRGFIVFNEKGKCVQCHFGADLTTHEFRNIGLFDGFSLNDSGRYAVTKAVEDVGKFKTPSLRNVALTAPYMHNGMFTTLRQVIDFYDETEKIVTDPINKDTILTRPLGLTENEKADLEAFLRSLTDKRFTK